MYYDDDCDDVDVVYVDDDYDEYESDGACEDDSECCGESDDTAAEECA